MSDLSQLGKEDIASLTYDEIADGLAQGRFNDLLGASSDATTPRKLGLHPSDVQQAIDAGRLKEFLAEHRGEAGSVGEADQGARGKPAPSTAKALRAELRNLPSDEVLRRFESGALDPLLKGELA
jgi:hypothetical protein